MRGGAVGARVLLECGCDGTRTVLPSLTTSDGNAPGAGSVWASRPLQWEGPSTKPVVLFGSPSHSLIWDSARTLNPYRFVKLCAHNPRPIQTSQRDPALPFNTKPF